MPNPLAEINKAEAALANASDIVDILVLRSQAKAVEVIAVAQGCADLAQHAKVFQLRAERKAGTWLGDNLQQGGNSKSRVVTLDDLDISKNESSRWQLIATVPDEKFHGWLDERMAKGQEVTAGGLRNYARNISGKPIVGRTTSGIYVLNPVGCALIGYGARCDGRLHNGHMMNLSKARGNAAVREYLSDPINISPQCESHNVGRWSDTREAMKIQLLQKIFKHGWTEVKDYYDGVPWKVHKVEFEFERMLE